MPSGRWTTDGDVLDVPIDAAETGLRIVRVVTIASPSWVAWREIEVETAE